MGVGLGLRAAGLGALTGHRCAVSSSPGSAAGQPPRRPTPPSPGHRTADRRPGRRRSRAGRRAATMSPTGHGRRRRPCRSSSPGTRRCLGRRSPGAAPASSSAGQAQLGTRCELGDRVEPGEQRHHLGQGHRVGIEGHARDASRLRWWVPQLHASDRTCSIDVNHFDHFRAHGGPVGQPGHTIDWSSGRHGGRSCRRRDPRRTA